MSPAAPKKKPPRKRPAASKRPAAKKSRSRQRPRKGPVAVRLEEIWFRGSTRIRAAGYWLGEKSKVVSAAVSPGKPKSTKSKRSPSSKAKPPAKTKSGARAQKAKAGRKKAKVSPLDRLGARERIGLGVAVLVCALVALILLVPLPLVPCSISPAKQCPPPDEAIDLVPADALLYAHLVRDPGSDQLKGSSEIGRRIPDFSAVSEAVLSGLAEDSGTGIQLGRDVLPWAEREVAIASLPSAAGAGSEALFIAGVSSRGSSAVSGAQAADLLETVSGGPPVERLEVDGTELAEYRKGLALARVGDFEVFGARSAVSASVGVAAGQQDRLSAEVVPRSDLPEQRFADIYVSRLGAKTLFGADGGSLSQLGAFVDYEATEGFAIALSAQEGDVVINIASDLSYERLKTNPNSITSVPGFSPELAALAPADSLAYFGVGEVGPTLSSAIATALGGELAASFRSLSGNLEQEAGPSPLSELLPALHGQAALILEPTEGPPEAILVVDQVDEQRANKALAELQQPLAKTLAGEKGGVARFEKTTQSGTDVYSLQGPSRLGISYAIDNGHLILSSTRAGVLRIIEGQGSLSSTPAWRGAVSRLSKSPSALLFLDLQELTRLAELAGLAEDPLYAALSDDISNIDSLGVSVDGEPTRLNSRIVLDLR